MGDIFGFNDHVFSLISINCHTHLGIVVIKNLELLVNVIMDFCKKNDIIDIKEKSNENTSKLGALAPTDSRHSSSLSMYMPKRVGDRGHPFLTPIFHLMYLYHPLLVLSLAVMV